MSFLGFGEVLEDGDKLLEGNDAVVVGVDLAEDGDAGGADGEAEVLDLVVQAGVFRGGGCHGLALGEEVGESAGWSVRQKVILFGALSIASRFAHTLNRSGYSCSVGSVALCSHLVSSEMYTASFPVVLSNALSICV